MHLRLPLGQFLQGESSQRDFADWSIPSYEREHCDSCFVEDFEFDDLRFQGVCVKQNHLSRLLELWDGDQSNCLARRTLDDSCLKRGLTANEVNMRTFFNDELVLVLKRVAP